MSIDRKTAQSRGDQVEREPVEVRQWVERGWSINKHERKTGVAVMAGVLFLIGLVTVGMTAWMVQGDRDPKPVATQRDGSRIEIWNVPADLRRNVSSEEVHYRRDGVPAATAGSVEYRRCRECGR